jgi:hypothetical protein
MANITALIAKLDDDTAMNDDDVHGPDYLWFQRPAPSYRVTLILATALVMWTAVQFWGRIRRLRRRFGPTEFRGSLRFCAMVSTYMDNEEPTFAVSRLVSKSLVFLFLLQYEFHFGFLFMLALIALESGLDTVRIFLAFQNCRSLTALKAASEEEAKNLKETTQLEPTNVYEDLTRPKTIAVMYVQSCVCVCVFVYILYDASNRFIVDL